MQLGICSFSFHRLLAAGKQDIFQYIADCRQLGCTQLDPWNAHLATLPDGDAVLHAGHNPDRSHHLSPVDEEYLGRVKPAADHVGLPFGCIAVDGAHIYETTEEKRQANRAKAYRWLAIAGKLGARQVRIDAGGPEEMPADVLEIIVAGYHDLVKRASDYGIELLIENHWGPSVIPDNVIKILNAAPGLGLLLDSWNWKPQLRGEGWLKCARYARATHIKTFMFTPDGEELTQNLPAFIRQVRAAGYRGAWGIESVPRDGDEIGAAQKTIALLQRTLGENGHEK